MSVKSSAASKGSESKPLSKFDASAFSPLSTKSFWACNGVVFCFLGMTCIAGWRARMRDIARDSLSFPTFSSGPHKEIVSKFIWGPKITIWIFEDYFGLRKFIKSGQRAREENCMTTCFPCYKVRPIKPERLAKYEGSVVLKILVFALFIMPPNEKAALLCML